MKTVISLLLGAMLSQASKEIPNNPELRKQRKEFRKELRLAKKQSRLINKITRLSKELDNVTLLKK